MYGKDECKSHFKIYIIHIYQIISFSPKMLPGVVQKKKKATIKTKDKNKI